MQNNKWNNPPPWNYSTNKHIIGGAAFGVGVRMLQLGILHKPLRTNPLSYGLSVLGWGFVGYWAWRWDVRAKELIDEKKAQLAARQGSIKGF